MLKTQLNRPIHISSLLFSKKSFAFAPPHKHSSPTPSSVRPRLVFAGHGRTVRSVSAKMKASAAAAATKADNTGQVKAIVATVQVTAGSLLSSLAPSNLLDGAADLTGKSLQLELVSSELNPKTGQVKEPVPSFAHKLSRDGTNVSYEGNFNVPSDFGTIGAILVTNEHHEEMYLKDITLQADDKSVLTFDCNSWVATKSESPEKRVFFTNTSYLPDQTPAGLKSYREKDLEMKRGNGKGERKSYERIYDYDVYDDLGDPSLSAALDRPVLGGNKQYPYPRRCRTGRPMSKKDPKAETRTTNIYVPRDEQFSEVKSLQFSATTLKQVLDAVRPSVSSIIDMDLSFPSFFAIDNLYEQGFKIPKIEGQGLLQTVIPTLLELISAGPNQDLLFDLPALVKRAKFSWLEDEEFARETLAGVNPYAIELVKEFPLKSKLDPAIYGPADSAITVEVLEKQLKGTITVPEALEQRRLFMLDYYDLFLPFVNKVRALPGTTLYGSRTIFFLTDEGALKPLAIELTRPKSPTQPQWKRAFTPSSDPTDAWLWTMAKAHVGALDSGHHELVSHFLRTHGCIEPFIIAANRQLSEMHPIYRLLHPHFRYTMEINAKAREVLINAGGVIELSFSPLKYSMELSSVAYDQIWRFDMEALPADLLRRGMAVEDPKAEHGLRLTIQDYPFANDGLLIWFAIKDWVHDYVSRYYPNSSDVLNDSELQEWWAEVRTKGHGDKQDASWWPKLDTPENLIQTLTTIMWVASAHHAAVNFSQYDYGGYIPNRPSIARTNMPVEDMTPEEFEKFKENPDKTLLDCFPSQIQATLVIAVLDLLSTHSPDEEYLGKLADVSWAEDPIIKAAYERFYDRLKEIEGIIDGRNSDARLKNRCGAGILPYELMKPFSGPGLTGKGIPNSTSI